MKHSFFFLSLFLVVSCTMSDSIHDCSLADSEIVNYDILISSKEEAVKLFLSTVDTIQGNCFIFPTVLPAGTRVESDNANEEPINVECPSWFVFQDPNPDAYWGHECIYYLISEETGSLTKTIHSMPPLLAEEMTAFLYETTENPDILMEQRGMDGICSQIDGANKWALIINTGGSKYINKIGYYYDCGHIYSALLTKGYSSDRIIVLASDGNDSEGDYLSAYYPDENGNDVQVYSDSPTDFDGDLQSDVDNSATYVNIASAFVTLASSVHSGDDVFIFITGPSVGGAIPYLKTWSSNGISEVLTASTLSGWIDVLPFDARVHVVFGGSYSGAFIPYVEGMNRCVSSACSSNREAGFWGIPNMNQYVRYWSYATAGQNFRTGVSVNGDCDGDGFLSFMDIHNYARMYTPAIDNPQFSDMGDISLLYDFYGQEIPYISGDTNIAAGNTATYSLFNLPDNSTVTWNISPGLNIVSGSGPSITVETAASNELLYGLQIVASVSSSYANFSRSVNDIFTWYDGIVSGQSILQGCISTNGGYVSLPDCFSTLYGYQWEAEGFQIVDQGAYCVALAPYGSVVPGDEVSVSVSLTNPLGGTTIIVDNFEIIE